MPSSSSSLGATAGLLLAGHAEADVVEESGPVEYLEEEEGLEDEDMEDLRYEGDPLLNSDNEEGGSSLTVAAVTCTPL